MGYMASPDKSSEAIQQTADMVPETQTYCADGYSGYLDVIFRENISIISTIKKTLSQ